MTKSREILRLKSLELSQQSIADSCNVSKKTVNRVLKRAKELDISWPLDKSNTNAVLAEKFFPSAKASAILYILVETAKATMINTFEYLNLLLTELPQHMDDKNLRFIDDLLLWSSRVQKKCLSRYKKP